MSSNLFLKEVENFPEMLKEAVSLGKDLKKIKRPAAVFIAGMGGSAISGDIAAGYLADKITVIRDYRLPSFAAKGDLLIAISYSGNTEETLEVFKGAKSAGLDIIAITSGGKLAKLSEKKIMVPSGVQPRSAMPYLLTALLKVLEKANLIPSQDKIILESARFLSGRLGELNARAQELAKLLDGKIPLIFASEGLTKAVGYRFKTQFNENSKVTAHLSIFPELNHNEIVNISYLKKGRDNFALLILRDKEDHPRIKKRIEITKSLISGSLADMREVLSAGENRLTRMLYLIFLGDLLTVHLALLKQRDPADVLVIEKLKKELGR